MESTLEGPLRSSTMMHPSSLLELQTKQGCSYLPISKFIVSSKNLKEILIKYNILHMYSSQATIKTTVNILMVTCV